MKSTITPLTSALLDDFLGTVNAYTAGWPYSRPIDAKLFKHWRTLGVTDEQVRLFRQGNQTLGAIQGELRGEVAQVHLLALRPGIPAEIGSELLADFCSRAKAAGATRVFGPNSHTVIYYGGYVLGNEPYHPHFATTVTHGYVRSGFHVSHPAVILVAHPPYADVEQSPAGYEVVPVSPAAEYDAQTLGFHAMKHGKKAAHCYARLYPHLLSSGRPVGQIGNVTTEEDHRNRGLARCMVRMALRQLQEMGAGEVLIATGLENYPALKAYENCGFVREQFIMEWLKKL